MLVAGVELARALDRLYPFARMAGLWVACRAWWDRNPWWYIDHSGLREEAAQAIQWARRQSGHDPRTRAGAVLIDLVAALEAGAAAEQVRG